MAKYERIINEDGEIGYFIPEAEAGDVTIRSRKQDGSWRKQALVNRANELRNQRHYINCYHEPIKDVTHTLKLNELGALTMLLPYLQFNRGGLLEADGKAMSSADIGKAIGKSGRTAKRILDGLVEAGIILKEGDRKATRYYIAERFHTIGYAHKKAFTKLYKDETRRRTRKLTIQEAGLIYKMLPYFHYATYYLVSNPDANRSKGEALEYLSQAELAELIGESLNTVKVGVNALVNQNILIKMAGCNKSKLLVNPDVMYRSERESEYTATVRMQFEEQDLGKSFD